MIWKFFYLRDITRQQNWKRKRAHHFLKIWIILISFLMIPYFSCYNLKEAPQAKFFLDFHTCWVQKSTNICDFFGKFFQFSETNCQMPKNSKISSACPKKMPTYLVLVGRREAALHRLRLFQISEKVNRLRLPPPPPHPLKLYYWLKVI